MGILDRFDQKGRASIDITSTGDTTLIVAPTNGDHIEIDFMNVFINIATTITFKDGTSAIGGSYNLEDKSTIVFENTSGFHPPIILTSNSAFVINQSETSQISGWVNYRIVGK